MPPIKGLGRISLGAMLGALGLALVVVEDRVSLLRCIVFSRPATGLGHFRQIDPLPTLSACPLRSDRVRAFAP
jgi:hypothetical protein